MEPNNGFNIILFEARRASTDVERKEKRMRREREKEGGSRASQSIKNTFEADQKPWALFPSIRRSFNLLPKAVIIPIFQMKKSDSAK